MFFKNLFSKFALIFFILLTNNCLSYDSDSDFYTERRGYSTPEKRTPKAKRQKTKDKENAKIDFNRTYRLQDAWVKRDPKFLSPASKLNYKSLLQIHPAPVKNPKFILATVNRETIASPVARQRHNRHEMRILIEDGYVTPLPADAFSEYQELPPETLEQKNLRKKLLHDYFLNINKVDYSTYQNLAQREAAYWVPFWNYIAKAKKEVLEGLREKIRPEELEDVALATALQEYKSFKAGETSFYYHTDFVDFSLVDSLGRTNAERLRAGLNPIGRDGLVMEIHHLTMFDDSILVLLSRSCHDGHTLKEVTQDPTATFHPQPKIYARCLSSDIDRINFAKIVTYICKELGKMDPIMTRKLLPVYVPVPDFEIEDFLRSIDVDESGMSSLSAPTFQQVENHNIADEPFAATENMTITVDEEDSF